MSGFFTILKNDIRIIFKDYKALFLILLMPIAIILIFTNALSPLLENNSFVEPFAVVIVDEDRSSWTSLLGAQLEELDIVEKVIYTDEKEARKLIKNQKAAAAIILPKDIVNSIDYLEPKDGKVIGSNLMYLQSTLVKNIAFVGSGAVSAGLASINVIYEYEQAAGYPEEKLYEEINESNQAFINIIMNRKAIVSGEKYQRPDVNPVVYYSLSLLGVFILFSSIPCMKLLTEERRMGILSRLNAGPVRSWHTVASKLIVSFLVSTAQFSVITLFMLSTGERSLSSAISSMIPVFLATTLAAGSFSIFIASISKSSSSADLIANLSILLMAVTGGSIYPMPSLPPVCRALSVITINRWATEGFMNALYGEDPSGTMRSLIPLILLTLLFIGFATVILKLRRRRAEG